MSGKAERTTQFILEKVAPVFNKNGYAGTSMADITSATGLTKGAVYGNFENKEILAIEAFKHNAKFVKETLASLIRNEVSMLDKLSAFSKFYRSYDTIIPKLGGCPILNVGVDTNHNDTPLGREVQKVMINLLSDLERIIEKGKILKEIKPKINASSYARKIFSIIEGSVFMASALKDNRYLQDGMDVLDTIIHSELKNYK